MYFHSSFRRENRQIDTRVIRIGVLRKVFSKNFCFIKSRRQHLWTVKWRRYSIFTFVKNTISNSLKVPRTKFLGNTGFFCLSSICKFGIFKNPFTAITSLYELCCRLRRFILLVQMKEIISMSHGSHTSN